jgi:hypothetical protein
VASNQSKYGANRNLWRKLYPIGSPRRAPETVNLVDPNTNVSYSLDLQRTIRHRDYFRIIQATSGSYVSTITTGAYAVGEYDEGLIHFNNTSDASFNYNITFSSTPFVVYTIEASAPAALNQENINVFGFSKTTTSAIVGLSAPFSGTVRYRAAYATSYPATFTSAFTASMIASAGSESVVYVTAYTASYTELPSTPTIFIQSPINTSASGQPDVFLDPDETSFTVTTTNTEFSAPYSGSIDFIAYV